MVNLINSLIFQTKEGEFCSNNSHKCFVKLMDKILKYDVIYYEVLGENKCYLWEHHIHMLSFTHTSNSSLATA